MTTSRLTNEQIAFLEQLCAAQAARVAAGDTYYTGELAYLELAAVRDLPSLLSEVRASRAAATTPEALRAHLFDRHRHLAGLKVRGQLTTEGACALHEIREALDVMEAAERRAGSAAREDGAPPSTSEPLTPLEEIAAALHAGTCPHNPQEKTQPIDCFECLMAALDRAQKCAAPAPGAAPATRLCSRGCGTPLPPGCVTWCWTCVEKEMNRG